MILRDLYCPGCDREKRDVFVDGDYPICDCGTRMRNWITQINADIWGGPQYHPALDKYFSTKGDLKKYMKEHRLVEAGDPVGGSRNEDYLRLGKRYSFAGQRNRSSRDYAERRDVRTLAPLVSKREKT